MKIQEVRKKSNDDLHKELAELKEQVRSLRFRVASKEIKNHQLLNMAKKGIAKILTVINERHGSNQGK